LQPAQGQAQLLSFEVAKLEKKLPPLIEERKFRECQVIQDRIDQLTVALTNSTKAAEEVSNRRFQRCLDLGCGTGLAGIAFRPCCAYIEGGDISKKMVLKARARELYDKCVHNDCVKQLRSHPTSSFDLIISADVVMYVFDIKMLFKEVKRVLAPGGLFSFSTESADDDVDGGVVERDSARYAHSRTYVQSVAADGFDLVNVENVTIRMGGGTDGSLPIAGDIFVFKRRGGS
jgi:predicted TPR repeat methyltransferase